MLKFLARLVSFLFNPLLILTYILIVLILLDPYPFGANSLASPNSRILILRVFLSSFFIPALAILMLYFLGMVRDLDLSDQQDRIGPYIITGIFYLWLVRNFWDNSIVPPIYTTFMLAGSIALFLAFLINIFSKISIHAVGLGSLIAMIVLCWALLDYNSIYLNLANGNAYQISLIFVLLICIFLAGLVGSSRLYLQNYEQNDLYGGYFVGLLSPFIALQVMVMLGKIQIPGL